MTVEPRRESADTFWVRIYMSGPIDVARQVLRAECLCEGLCVTIDATDFIYTGGEERGFVVGFVNYPRFPQPHLAILARALGVAEKLIAATHQHSALVQTPTTTEWISYRPENRA